MSHPLGHNGFFKEAGEFGLILEEKKIQSESKKHASAFHNR